MSCDQNSTRAARAAGPSGINQAGSQSGFTTGQTAQVSFFAQGGRERRPQGRRKRRPHAGRRPKRGAQVSFFERDPAADKPEPAAPPWTAALPRRRQIYIAQEFTPAELDQLIVQFHLGEAATTRHIRELNNGRTRGIGHSDPRPLDWARLDQQQYRFLIDQLRRARRGQGYVDTSGLKKTELVELWEFARFETDRAHRNIDHLASGLSHLKGPTAAYLIGGHQLEARFYSVLAGHLEPLIPTEIRSRKKVI